MDTEPAPPIVMTIVVLGVLPLVCICCFCVLYFARMRSLHDFNASERRNSTALAGALVLRFIHPEQGDAPCDDRGPCCICSDYASNVVFEPCKHDLFCARCAVIIWMTSRSCPLCRQAIQSIMHGEDPLGLTSDDGQLLSHSIGDVIH